MDLEVNKKYKIISIQSVTTNFGPRYRIETEEFKFELPARYNTLPEEAKTAQLNKTKFVTYKGRDRENRFAINLFDFEGLNHIFFNKNA